MCDMPKPFLPNGPQRRLFDIPEPNVHVTKGGLKVIKPAGAMPAEYPGSFFADYVDVYILCGHKRYTVPETSFDRAGNVRSNVRAGQRFWVHYIGCTENLNRRLYLHRKGASGVALIRAMLQQGIKLRVGYTRRFEFAQEGWNHEIMLKRSHHAPRYCKFCRARWLRQEAQKQRQRLQRQGHAKRQACAAQRKSQPCLKSISHETIGGKRLCKIRKSRTASP